MMIRLKNTAYGNSWTLDASVGLGTLDSGLLDTGRCTLDAGLWALGTGHWTLFLTSSVQN